MQNPGLLLASEASSLHRVPARTHLFLLSCCPSTCQEKGQWECDQEPCLVDQDMINAINQGNYG